MATSENRTIFARAILHLVSEYDLDGIDFDWEYPGQQGAGDNIVSKDDSANFLTLLQELRAQPGGQNLTLSAAVGLTPFIGSDGSPMDDVSDFAQVLDYIGDLSYLIEKPRAVALTIVYTRNHELRCI